MWASGRAWHRAVGLQERPPPCPAVRSAPACTEQGPIRIDCRAHVPLGETLPDPGKFVSASVFDHDREGGDSEEGGSWVTTTSAR